MKKKLVILLSLVIQLINFSLFSINENRELIWKKFSQINESRLPGYIRNSMQDALTGYFNNTLSSNARLNSDFKYFQPERNYYFTSAQEKNSNEDYSCIARVKWHDHIHVSAWHVAGTGEWKWRWNGYYHEKYLFHEYKAEAYLYIDFKQEYGANTSESFKSDVWKKKIVNGEHNDPPKGIEVEYICNKENPIISKNVFLKSPDKYYKAKKHDKDSSVGSYDHGNVPEGECLCWVEEDEETCTYYPAKSPLPRLNEYVHKQFDDEEFIHNNRIYDTEVITDMNVKILLTRFYRLNEGNGVYEYDPINNPDIVHYINSSESGICNVKISEKIYDVNNNPIIDGYDEFGNPIYKNRFAEEGRYIMAVGAVDKFNKIYIFEPEYFIVDRTSPVITGAVVTENQYLTGDEPVLADLSSITIDEEFTDYSGGLLDYLYVNELSTGVFIPLSNSDKLIFRDNKIYAINQNKGIEIRSLVLIDKAGNKSEPIIGNRSYYWDNTPPRVLPNAAVPVDGYLNSKANLTFDIIEESPVEVISVRAVVSGLESTNFIHYPSAFNDLLIVDISELRGVEGNLEVTIVLRDRAGNYNVDTQNFTFKYDDKQPSLTAALDGKNIYNFYSGKFNQSAELVINANDINFDRIILSMTSDSSVRVDVVINDPNTSYIVEKIGTGVVENIVLDIKAYDLAGNLQKIESVKLALSRDIDPPIIITIPDAYNLWSYYLDIMDKDEKSMIGKIYYKDITSNNVAGITIDDFGAFPPEGEGWQVLMENVMHFKTEVDILPGHAVCIVAEDIWGNRTAPADCAILTNILQSYTEINNQSDLDNPEIVPIPWELSGVVVLNTDIIVPAGKELRIKTYGVNDTIIRVNSSVDKYRIINRGGTIRIDSSDNKIIFSGSEEGEDDYTWFGIVNESGDIIFEGGNKVSFNNAVAGLTYENPIGTEEIKINNMVFKKCKIGIHMIDYSAAFNKINIDSIEFIDVIYGVKFDITGEIDKSSYLSGYPYLTDKNILDNNIIRSHVYCPVNGLVDFTSYNSAPSISNVKIEGIAVYNNNLTVSFDFNDNDAGDFLDEAGTLYQWYISTKIQGPYSPITNETNNNYTPKFDDIGKWLIVKVTPKDNKGSFGSSELSEPKLVANQPPVIAGPIIIGGTPIFSEAVFPVYNFVDLEGHEEGNSKYQWYISDTEFGEYNAIAGANEKSFVIHSIEYANKWLRVDVTPVDETGVEGAVYQSEVRKLGSLLGPYVFNGIVWISAIEVEPGETLDAGYEYRDTDGYPEGNSLITWYISDARDGEYAALSDTGGEVVIRNEFIGKWMRLVVQPINSIGVKGDFYESEPAYIIDVNDDEYDYSGVGNSTSNAVDMGTLNYNGIQSKTFKGFINFKQDDRDFFKFTVIDPLHGGKNYGGRNLHVRIKFLSGQNPDSAYGVKIWEGRTGDSPYDDADPDTTEEVGDTIYYQFDWGLRTAPIELRTIRQVENGQLEPGYDPDEIFAVTYIIEITKHDIVRGINLMYEVEVSNGKYPDFNPEN